MSTGAQKQLNDLIKATGAKTLGEAMIRVRDWRFGAKLTIAELNHFLSLLEAEKATGSYAGPREQYYARTERLITWCHQRIQQDVLRRRRAIMPDYDEKLKEWLS